MDLNDFEKGLDVDGGLRKHYPGSCAPKTHMKCEVFVQYILLNELMLAKITTYQNTLFIIAGCIS